jgi:hypothetical protein
LFASTDRLLNKLPAFVDSLFMLSFHSQSSALDFFRSLVLVEPKACRNTQVDCHPFYQSYSDDRFISLLPQKDSVYSLCLVAHRLTASLYI